MFEDDIFKILLVVLLLANENGGNDRDMYRRLNEILIICMLMGSGCAPDPCGCARRRDRCGCGNNCDCGQPRTSF